VLYNIIININVNVSVTINISINRQTYQHALSRTTVLNLHLIVHTIGLGKLLVIFVRWREEAELA